MTALLEDFVTDALDAFEAEEPLTPRMREHLAGELRRRFLARLDRPTDPMPLAWGPEAPTVPGGRRDA